jgi:hypothetical protein
MKKQKRKFYFLFLRQSGADAAALPESPIRDILRTEQLCALHPSDAVGENGAGLGGSYEKTGCHRPQGDTKV